MRDHTFCHREQYPHFAPRKYQLKNCTYFCWEADVLCCSKNWVAKNKTKKKQADPALWCSCTDVAADSLGDITCSCAAWYLVEQGLHMQRASWNIVVGFCRAAKVKAWDLHRRRRTLTYIIAFFLLNKLCKKNTTSVYSSGTHLAYTSLLYSSHVITVS